MITNEGWGKFPKGEIHYSYHTGKKRTEKRKISGTYLRETNRVRSSKVVKTKLPVLKHCHITSAALLIRPCVSLQQFTLPGPGGEIVAIRERKGISFSVTWLGIFSSGNPAEGMGFSLLWSSRQTSSGSPVEGTFPLTRLLRT